MLKVHIGLVVEFMSCWMYEAKCSIPALRREKRLVQLQMLAEALFDTSVLPFSFGSVSVKYRVQENIQYRVQ